MNSPDKGVVTAGVAGGNLLSLAAIVTGADMGKTAILALVGAVVSFTATLVLKKITSRRRR